MTAVEGKLTEKEMGDYCGTHLLMRTAPTDRFNKFNRDVKIAMKKLLDCEIGTPELATAKNELATSMRVARMWCDEGMMATLYGFAVSAGAGEETEQTDQSAQTEETGETEETEETEESVEGSEEESEEEIAGGGVEEIVEKFEGMLAINN